ncbi:LysR substrate-binding domain-containing protein [Sphingomonas sp. RS6]
MNNGRKLPPLATLRAFEAAARHLSFRKAAAELGVTPTAISHQIRLLEDVLGQPMFTRHVRRVSLTPSGALLYPVLRDGFDAFAQTLAQIGNVQKRATVVLSATRLFTARLLVPALGRFSEANPDIDLHLHASDLCVDLEAGDADLAVRYGGGPFDGLVAEPLMVEQTGVLCSPALGVATPADLRRVQLLHAEWISPAAGPDWAAWTHQAGILDLPVSAGPRFTDDAHALQAAIAGHGAVVSSLVLASPDLASGLLVQPFGPVIDGKAYHIVARPAAAARPDVLAVWAWLRALAPSISHPHGTTIPPINGYAAAP